MIRLGQGPNPARQASVKAGLPASVPAWVVSMLCGSGMKAIIQGYLSVATGNCQIVVVGGQENASQVIRKMTHGNNHQCMQFMDVF